MIEVLKHMNIPKDNEEIIIKDLLLDFSNYPKIFSDENYKYLMMFLLVNDISNISITEEDFINKDFIKSFSKDLILKIFNVFDNASSCVNNHLIFEASKVILKNMDSSIDRYSVEFMNKYSSYLVFMPLSKEDYPKFIDTVEYFQAFGKVIDFNMLFSYYLIKDDSEFRLVNNPFSSPYLILPYYDEKMMDKFLHKVQNFNPSIFSFFRNFPNITYDALKLFVKASVDKFYIRNNVKIKTCKLIYKILYDYPEFVEDVKIFKTFNEDIMPDIMPYFLVKCNKNVQDKYVNWIDRKKMPIIIDSEYLVSNDGEDIVVKFIKMFNKNVNKIKLLNSNKQTICIFLKIIEKNNIKLSLNSSFINKLTKHEWEEIFEQLGRETLSQSVNKNIYFRIMGE